MKKRRSLQSFLLKICSEKVYLWQYNMKRMQQEESAAWKEWNTKKAAWWQSTKNVRKKSNVIIVQHGIRATWKECNRKKMQHKKSAIQKKCNMGIAKHEKSATRKKCTMIKVQHEEKWKVKGMTKNEKSEIRWKCNMGRVQHEESVTIKECNTEKRNMEKVQY